MPTSTREKKKALTVKQLSLLRVHAHKRVAKLMLDNFRARMNKKHGISTTRAALLLALKRVKFYEASFKTPSAQAKWKECDDEGVLLVDEKDWNGFVGVVQNAFKHGVLGATKKPAGRAGTATSMSKHAGHARPKRGHRRAVSPSQEKAWAESGKKLAAGKSKLATQPPSAPNEALRFMDTKSTGPFASNRFGKAEAIAFFKDLYHAGAPLVTVAGIYDEPERIKREGGPYADTAIVTMPKSMAAKARVMEVLKWYEPDELQKLAGGKRMRAWWD
ncbi:MAG: hypothetical protein ACHREM_02240 [Polyangiales bacterium]